LKNISNRKLTLLRKLNKKKYRNREKLFLAEGDRAVKQIIENKQCEVEALFFDESQTYWQQDFWQGQSRHIDSSIVARDDFTAVSDTDHPQGVIALCGMPDGAQLKILAQKNGLIVATDAIRDPGNLGTIVRTAVWFGGEAILSGKGTVDLYHPKVVRATAGSTGVIPHANGNLIEMLPVFEEQGWRALLLDAGAGAESLKNIKAKDKTIVIIGNEAHGVNELLMNPKRSRVQIPSANNEEVESLNAAVALSIALYALS